MLAVDKSDVQVAAVGLEAGSLEALGFCLQDSGAVFYHSEQQRSGFVQFIFCFLLGRCYCYFIAVFINSVASAEGRSTQS